METVNVNGGEGEMDDNHLGSVTAFQSPARVPATASRKHTNDTSDQGAGYDSDSEGSHRLRRPGPGHDTGHDTGRWHRSTGNVR